MIEKLNQIKDFIFAIAVVFGLIGGSVWVVAEVWFRFQGHDILIQELREDMEYMNGRMDRKIENHEQEYHK